MFRHVQTENLRRRESWRGQRYTIFRPLLWKTWVGFDHCLLNLYHRLSLVYTQTMKTYFLSFLTFQQSCYAYCKTVCFFQDKFALKVKIFLRLHFFSLAFSNLKESSLVGKTCVRLPRMAFEHLLQKNLQKRVFSVFSVLFRRLKV
jgi:hypothetical protein